MVKTITAFYLVNRDDNSGPNVIERREKRAQKLKTHSDLSLKLNGGY